MEEDTRIAEPKRNFYLVRYISVGIAAVAITFGFQLVHRYQTATVLQFILPLPVVFVAIRYSLWLGILTIVLATIITGLLSGYLMGILLGVSSGVVAVIFAVSFLRSYSATVTVSCVTLYYIVVGIVSVYVQTGLTYEAYIQNLMIAIEEQLINIYKTQEMAGQNFKAQFEALARVLSINFPLISALSTSIIMYGATRIGLKMQKISLVPLTPFHRWKISDQLVWIFILGGILYHVEITRIIGINIILGLVFLYYLQGCAITIYFLKQRHVSKFVQILAYILLFIQIPYIFVSLGLVLTGYAKGEIYLPLFSIILVAGIGLANIWIDFHKRMEKGQT